MSYDSNLSRRRLLRNSALIGGGCRFAAGGLYWSRFFDRHHNGELINFTAPSSYDLDAKDWAND